MNNTSIAFIFAWGRFKRNKKGSEGRGREEGGEGRRGEGGRREGGRREGEEGGGGGKDSNYGCALDVPLVMFKQQ